MHNEETTTFPNIITFKGAQYIDPPAGFVFQEGASLAELDEIDPLPFID